MMTQAVWQSECKCFFIFFPEIWAQGNKRIWLGCWIWMNVDAKEAIFISGLIQIMRKVLGYKARVFLQHKILFFYVFV